LGEDDPVVEFAFVEGLEGYSYVGALLEEGVVEGCGTAEAMDV